MARVVSLLMKNGHTPGREKKHRKCGAATESLDTTWSVKSVFDNHIKSQSKICKLLSAFHGTKFLHHIPRHHGT
jgi:ribosomal protein RSM22 (predicted rRNA methylase)